MIIVNMEDDVYYARLILEAQNEVMEHKIVELDCRPSDGLAIATSCDAPVYVVRELWERLEDMTYLLKQIEQGPTDGDFPPF